MYAAREQNSNAAMREEFFMNCICNLFNNESLIWIIIIAALLLSCYGGNGYCGGHGNGCYGTAGNGGCGGCGGCGC